MSAEPFRSQQRYEPDESSASAERGLSPDSFRSGERNESADQFPSAQAAGLSQSTEPTSAPEPFLSSGSEADPSEPFQPAERFESSESVRPEAAGDEPEPFQPIERFTPLAAEGVTEAAEAEESPRQAGDDAVREPFRTGSTFEERFAQFGAGRMINAEEPFRPAQQFRPEERFQPRFEPTEPEPEPADQADGVVPERIEDTGPSVIEPDPATLAGVTDEPELLTHHAEPPADELESTQLHHPFEDEPDDEPDTEAGAPPAQPRRADLSRRADDESTVEPGGLGGAGLFTPTVPVDPTAPRTPRAPARRAQREPAELFTPSTPVNGSAVEEPAEPVAAQKEPPPREAPRREAARAAKPAGGPPWPIKPMSGEPPLTLFRGKEMRELPEGTEVDRYGEPDGNLTYTVSTPFEQRSLVPDWVHRPYHVYRVVRPVDVLTGVAIPWFDQPGGGTAFLLPEAVGDLVDAGYLVEVEDAKPPN